MTERLGFLKLILLKLLLLYEPKKRVTLKLRIRLKGLLTNFPKGVNRAQFCPLSENFSHIWS